MELSMSGGALRTFTRCVACLARVGSDLVLQAHTAKLELHTLNSSRFCSPEARREAERRRKEKVCLTSLNYRILNCRL